MRVCRTFGCTLEELGERMSLSEFRLWQEFDVEWPMQDLRADVHSAQVTQAVVNMAGKAIKDPVTLMSKILFQDQPKPTDDDPLDFFKGK